MNRVRTTHSKPQSTPPAAAAPQPPAAQADAAAFTTAGSAHCSLFTPLHYEPGYAYPLVVWLHGPGDSEAQLKRIMPLVSMRNYAAVAPRGTTEVRRANGGTGYDWGQQRFDLTLAEHRLDEALELAASKYHLAPDRVWLAGFRSGGSMALLLALTQPNRFAGVLSLGGRFPRGRRALLHLSQARSLPVFLACGRTSTEYSTDDVCEDLRLLHTAGMNVALRQYPCGDELTPWMLADLDRWIMEQITQPAAKRVST